MINIILLYIGTYNKRNIISYMYIVVKHIYMRYTFTYIYLHNDYG